MLPLSPFLHLGRTIIRHRELIGTFVRRDLRGRYAGSLLGTVWAVSQPLVLLAVYTFVFGNILRMDFRMGKTGDLPRSYTAFFLFAGMVPWLAFSETLSRSTAVMLENANLIKKVAFPAEVLPIYLVIYGLVNMLIGVAILVLGAFYVGIPPGLALLWLPVLMLVQALFTLGLGFFLSGLNVFVRDTMQLVGLGLTLWMFMTPLFYTLAFVPEPYRGMFKWNPMHHLIAAYRAIFVERSAPSAQGLGVFAGVGLLTLLLGAAWFQRAKHRFADEI